MVSTPVYVLGSAALGLAAGVVSDRAMADAPSRVAERQSHLAPTAGDPEDLPSALPNRLVIGLPILGGMVGAGAAALVASSMPVDLVWHRRPTGAAALGLAVACTTFGAGATVSRLALG